MMSPYKKEELLIKIISFSFFHFKPEIILINCCCYARSGVGFKKMLEKYLIDEYESGFRQGFVKSSRDIQKYMDLLLMTETYSLNTLHALFMDQKPWLGRSEKLIRSEKFKQFSDITRYEIIRNTIIHRYRLLS